MTTDAPKTIAEMREALKPCPFCGGTDLHQYDDEAHTNWIRCMDCGAGTDQGFAHQVAKWWNRRPAPTTNPHTTRAPHRRGRSRRMSMATSPERERIIREIGALSKRLDEIRQRDTSMMTEAERYEHSSSMMAYFNDKMRAVDDLRRLRAKGDAES